MKLKNTIILIVVILIILIGLIFGLRFNNGKKSGTLYCTYHNKLIYIEFKNIYKIKYKNRYVTSINTYEEIKSSDDEELLKYEVKLTENYSKYKNLKYYNNNITIKKNKIISRTSINYSKINMDELLEIDDSLKSYLTKDNKLNISDIKKLYEKDDVRCVYK